MHALFYQMKAQRAKREIIFDEYYKGILDNVRSGSEDYLNKCRICLREAIVPLYGTDQTQTIVEVLEQLTNVHLNEDDGYPNHLCTVCYKFIKAFVLFRKTAKHIDDILKQHVKEEINVLQPSDDHHNYSDDSVNEKEPCKNWDSEVQQEVKKEVKRVKCSTKVTCHICNKVINRSYYKEHITMHDPDHKKYVCDVCGKSFRLRCAYHNHSLRHRTDFVYKCQFCPYRGRYAELLKTHMRTHSGDYRYMCTECPARFLFKSNLNSHMLKHKEPKFKCDTCKRAFHTKLLLQRHFEADHLGIKNHVCGMCGKAFGYRNAMMKHQRHVHKREKQLFGRMPSYLQEGCGN